MGAKIWVPAARVYTIDMTTIADGGMILPGSQYRRGLIFSTGGLTIINLSPFPNSLPGCGMFNGARDAIATFTYKDWGQLITNPWYNNQIGATGDLCIYEVYFS